MKNEGDIRLSIKQAMESPVPGLCLGLSSRAQAVVALGRGD
ncbi:MAG TPA: hypothetical protein PKW81_04250 [Synergistales bacterium]|nr:hypothetical protein [Synergistales bacterium]HRS48562.1 hypothetical protein [Thermovirgaceae bacterium]